jgi:hypothetical protein
MRVWSSHTMVMDTQSDTAMAGLNNRSRRLIGSILFVVDNAIAVDVGHHTITIAHDNAALIDIQP